MQTGNLFDNRPTRPAAKPARVPAWVIKELTDVHGLDQRAVRAMHPRQAFARLFAARRKSMVLTPADRAALCGATSARLNALVENPEHTANETADAILEALALLDGGPLDRVAKGVAKLLSELAA